MGTRYATLRWGNEHIGMALYGTNGDGLFWDAIWPSIDEYERLAATADGVLDVPHAPRCTADCQRRPALCTVLNYPLSQWYLEYCPQCMRVLGPLSLQLVEDAMYEAGWRDKPRGWVDAQGNLETQ